MRPSSIQHVPIKDLQVGRNIRDLDQERVKQFAESIRKVGQLEPGHARRVGGKLMLTEGFHRLAACELAGKETFAVIVDEGEVSDSEVLRLQLISNCVRENLSPVQQARAVQAYMDFAGFNAGQAATELGLSISKVSQLRNLLTLSKEILDHVEAGKIPVSGAYELARVDDAELQADLARQMAAGQLTRDAAAGKRKAAKRGGRQGECYPARVTAMLGESRSITIASAGLTLDRLIALIEELLAKARRERGRGTELGTFISLLRDQARAK